MYDSIDAVPKLTDGLKRALDTAKRIPFVQISRPAKILDKALAKPVRSVKAKARYHGDMLRLSPARHFLGGCQYQEDGLPPAGHTQSNQANPNAGGPRRSLSSEICPTPLATFEL